MTTTSEKILSEMQRMGRMKIKDLCAQMHWQYQKFRRRIKANDYICEQMMPEWCETHCIDHLRQGCVIEFLTNMYEPEKEK